MITLKCCGKRSRINLIHERERYKWNHGAMMMRTHFRSIYFYIISKNIKYIYILFFIYIYICGILKSQNQITWQKICWTISDNVRRLRYWEKKRKNVPVPWDRMRLGAVEPSKVSTRRAVPIPTGGPMATHTTIYPTAPPGVETRTSSIRTSWVRGLGMGGRTPRVMGGQIQKRNFFAIFVEMKSHKISVVR